MGNKEQKIYAKAEFRRNLLPEAHRHPVFIAGKQGHYYYAIGITHSNFIDGIGDTIPLTESPAPDDTRRCFAKPFIEKIHKRYLGEKLIGWEASSVDLAKFKAMFKRALKKSGNYVKP